MRPGQDGVPHRRNGRDCASALRAGRRRGSMPRERKRRASAGSIRPSPGPNRTCSSPRHDRQAVEAQALEASTHPGEPGGRLHGRTWRILQSVRPSFPCIRIDTDAEASVARAEGHAGRRRKAEYGREHCTARHSDERRWGTIEQGQSLPPRRGVRVPQLVVSGPRPAAQPAALSGIVPRSEPRVQPDPYLRAPPRRPRARRGVGGRRTCCSREIRGL